MGLSLGLSTPVRAADDSSAPFESTTEPTSESAAESPESEGDAELDSSFDSDTDLTDEPAEQDEAPVDVPTEREAALDALEEVEELTAPVSRPVARERIESGEGRHATMALRDLALRMDALNRTERRITLGNYTRPAGGHDFTKRCQANICVHYYPTGSAAAAAHPEDAATDAWAQQTLATLVHVSQTYQAAGYRLPKGDGTYGGDARTDVYLADVGATGRYGYCTADFYANGRPVFNPGPNRSDLPAFCVLDNDYHRAQFGADPKQTLEVTAAHEYTHAVQFAYDYGEDRWFMEAAATWAEEQIYDHINDNRQYLRFSQLRRPGLSLDTYGGANGFLQYGDWVFFQYLTERIPARTGALPNLMLSIWKLADSVSGPDYYSTRAIQAALAQRGVKLPRIFAQYAVANRHPARAYSEGAAFPTSGARTTPLRPKKRAAAGSFRVDHLASKTVRFVPKRLRAKRNKLRIEVNMANRGTGSLAAVTVYSKTGGVRTRFVKLNKAGNGKIRTAFNSRQIRYVELTLVNANRTFKQCWVARSAFSCRGVPVRDDMLEKYSVRAVR